MHLRFPKNCEGDFYTVGEYYKGVWCGSCLQCDLPETEAPTLFAPLEDGNMDTYLVKQPSTEKELQQIINAIDVCCVSALRYGGKNPDILSRISPEYCDYAMHSDGTIVQRDSSVAVMQDEKDMWASKLEPKKEFLKSKLASLVGRLGIKRR